MEEDIKYEEVQDALCVLLHCSLKDKEYETQKQQFDSVMNYIDRLQKENEKLKEEIMESNLKVIGTEEYTKASMGEIIENYYTANEDCIPKSVIQDEIEELESKLNVNNNIRLYTLKDSYELQMTVLEELLNKGE